MNPETKEFYPVDKLKEAEKKQGLPEGRTDSWPRFNLGDYCSIPTVNGETVECYIRKITKRDIIVRPTRNKKM